MISLNFPPKYFTLRAYDQNIWPIVYWKRFFKLVFNFTFVIRYSASSCRQYIFRPSRLIAKIKHRTHRYVRTHGCRRRLTEKNEMKKILLIWLLLISSLSFLSGMNHFDRRTIGFSKKLSYLFSLRAYAKKYLNKHSQN